MSVPYFNTREFAEVLTIGSASVVGIWSNGYTEDGVMSGTNPEFLCREVDATAVSRGDSVTRASTTYKVRKLEPDGTGLLVIVLEKQ